MKRQIKIELVGTDLTVVADLLDEVNPEICDIVWNSLPHHSPLFHTTVSGSNLYSCVRTTAPFYRHKPVMWRRLNAKPGTIFSPFPRAMFIKYGPDSEDHLYPPVAQVADNSLPALKEIGKAGWESVYSTKETKEIRITRLNQADDANSSPADLLDPNQFGSDKLRNIVGDLREAIDTTWFRPPTELIDLYSGKHSAKTGMGSHGQYFSTLFFAEGEASRISNIAHVGAVDNLLRLCHAGELGLPELKAATHTLCHASLRYLELCGLHSMSQPFFDLVDQFDAIATTDEFFQLFSLYSLYAFRFHTWNMLLFPWAAGKNQHAYMWDRANGVDDSAMVREHV